MSRMSDFDRQFNRNRRIINMFFVFCFVFILVVWSAFGYGVYYLINNSNEVARHTGNVVGEFIQGVKEKN